MSSPEPFAPRDPHPGEVLVPPAARDSFAQLWKVGGATLWLCATLTLGGSLLGWDAARPETWISATGDLAGAVWQPVLGSVLLLQNLGATIPLRSQRWLSLMTWAVLGWGILLIALMALTGLGTARIYQRQTEEQGAAETAVSERFRRIREALAQTSEPAELKRVVTAARISLPEGEVLPEAPRPLRERLIFHIGAQEEQLDAESRARLGEEHAQTLVTGLSRLFAALAAAAAAIVAWARTGWIRDLRDRAIPMLTSPAFALPYLQTA